MGSTAIIVYAAIFTAVGTVVGWALKAILHEVRVIADRLNPDTPGGIRDLLNALDDNNVGGFHEQ